MHLLPPELPWISSHPSHGDREKKLNETMTKALELRKDSGVRYLIYYMLDYKICTLYNILWTILVINYILFNILINKI